MKKKIIFACLAIVSAVIIFCVIHNTPQTNQPASHINEEMENYINTQKWDSKKILSAFSDDSAEALFSKGMEAYAANQPDLAADYFKKAEKESYSDAALPIYVQIYLNECAVAKNGIGEPRYVKKALNQIAKQPELIDHIHWAWLLTYSLVDSENPDTLASDILEDYIHKAKELDEDEILLLNTYRGILKNISGTYSESILLFYSLLNQSYDISDSYYKIKAQSICINYIGDMYYSYEDYEDARRLYQELIDQKIADPSENAKLKYSAYVNMGDIYVRQKDYKQAKKMVSETKDILAYLPESTAIEINAFLHNILTNIELEQNHLDAAAVYFKTCEDFMANNESDAFFDTNIYFGVTKSKLLQRTGKLEEAEQLLSQLLKDNIVETNMRHQIRELLADIYRQTNQDAKYQEQTGLILKEKDQLIKQYQNDYCEIINYYDDFLDLQREHWGSLHQNKILLVALLIVLMLLAVIIKLFVSKYTDSLTDSLSGLYNRKKLEQEFTLYDKRKHKSTSYGIIMADIDFFKKYNDTYGHMAGDNVIRRVSALIKQSVRAQDIVIRYGGEEILILLKDVSNSTVESIAERIRSNIENEKIIHAASECNKYITLSLGGFHTKDTASTTLDEAIKMTDKALYHSKLNGRNKVTIFSQSSLK